MTLRRIQILCLAVAVAVALGAVGCSEAGGGDGTDTGDGQGHLDGVLPDVSEFDDVGSELKVDAVHDTVDAVHETVGALDLKAPDETLDTSPDGADANSDLGADTAADTAADTGADTGQDTGSNPTVPLAGFGTISGECGVIDVEEIQSPSPYVFVNRLDFGWTPYTGDLSVLSVGAQEVFTDGNAGGSSALSETFSFDVLYRCELAQLIKSETEIGYDTPGKLTDILVGLDGLKVGVSVTRAQSWPLDAEYPLTQAQSLLDKKLKGVLATTANVKPEDAWEKQILHVLAYGDQHAEALLQAWETIDGSVKADTILMITVTDGNDLFIYTE